VYRQEEKEAIQNIRGEPRQTSKEGRKSNRRVLIIILEVYMVIPEKLHTGSQGIVRGLKFHHVIKVHTPGKYIHGEVRYSHIIPRYELWIVCMCMGSRSSEEGNK
jgi:hypothetical protein